MPRTKLTAQLTRIEIEAVFAEYIATEYFTENYQGDRELGPGIVIHDDFDHPMLVKDGEFLAGRALYQPSVGWGIVHVGMPVNKDTILHELAHLLAAANGHGKVWSGHFNELKKVSGAS